MPRLNDTATTSRTEPLLNSLVSCAYFWHSFVVPLLIAQWIFFIRCDNIKEHFTILFSLLNKTDTIKMRVTWWKNARGKKLTKWLFFFFSCYMCDRLSRNLYFICIHIVEAPLLSNFFSPIPSNVTSTAIIEHPRPESNKQKPHLRCQNSF